MYRGVAWAGYFGAECVQSRIFLARTSCSGAGIWDSPLNDSLCWRTVGLAQQLLAKSPARQAPAAPNTGGNARDNCADAR